jgi:hypothetical protein
MHGIIVSKEKMMQFFNIKIKKSAMEIFALNDD